MRSILLGIAQYQFLRHICLVLALVLIAMIFAMADSSYAKGDLNFNPPLDKLLHALVYGTIAALLLFAGIMRSRFSKWQLVVGIGVVDELQQSSISGRESSLHDLLADVVGVTLGLWLAGWILSRLLMQRS